MATQDAAEVLREELALIREEMAEHGRRRAFGALTTAVIAAVGREDRTRAALMVAAIYGASAGALAEAGIKRLGRITPEAVADIQHDVKQAAKAVQRAA